MDSSRDFSGIWIPLVTPFLDGAVDHAGLRRLVTRLAGSGVAGLVLNGSTGEAAALSEAEQLAVLDTACGTLPVIAGISGITPQAVAARLDALRGRDLAGVLLTPPYYVRPSQAGIAEHFRRAADASPAPLLLYDIPARTGVRIETATMLGLAAHPNIAAVKDCSGDLDHAQAVINDGRLQVLAGDDHRLFTTLCQGGVGAICASAHLRPDLFVALHRAVATNDLRTAAALWRRLWPLTKALFAEPNPAPLKAALALLDGLGPDLRAPMTAASPEALASVLAAVEALR
ncbi:4-hydroxy-tetrahydrodipicolinate synthase [Pelomonas sp. KK5]|uniref:4-hydroxy-tetrahydrodipicolinate synthase family protein n=1 Tax=Pelomonas sp. KK5 TaxID=1855730 RepID=UPI00097BF760|nr:4-hydroxy-tetrahydrodipicolinate synthase [Pelomonas sp. KK5]